MDRISDISSNVRRGVSNVGNFLRNLFSFGKEEQQPPQQPTMSRNPNYERDRGYGDFEVQSPHLELIPKGIERIPRYLPQGENLPRRSRPPVNLVSSQRPIIQSPVAQREGISDQDLAAMAPAREANALDLINPYARTANIYSNPVFFPGGALGNRQAAGTPDYLKQAILNAVEENSFTGGQIRNVSPMLLSALLASESDFRPDVLGPTLRTGEQAAGMAQFLPSTISDLVNRGILSRDFNPVNYLDSINASAAYLDYLINQSGGDVLTGLARYKGGNNPSARGYAQQLLDLTGSFYE